MTEKLVNQSGLAEYTKKIKEKTVFIKSSSSTTMPSALDVFYPIGSLYMSMDSSFDPNTAWGGTWTKITAGRFIETTTTASQVANTVSAGLPNIEGSFMASRSAYSVSGVVGAFTGTTMEGSTKPVGESGSGDMKVVFKASNSNSIYGRSTTVQPASIKAFIWRRTA